MTRQNFSHIIFIITIMILSTITNSTASVLPAHGHTEQHNGGVTITATSIERQAAQNTTTQLPNRDNCCYRHLPAYPPTTSQKNTIQKTKATLDNPAPEYNFVVATHLTLPDFRPPIF